MAESRVGGPGSMTPREQHRRAMELFDRARELADGARRQFLDEACAGDDDSRNYVESLLRYDESPIDLIGAIERGDGARLVDFNGTEDDPVQGAGLPVAEQVGAYTVIELIAQGGMGAVYKARQDNPNRIVALKVIRAGDTAEQHARRLRREAHVLGRLQHPGIATIFDAGAADIRMPDGRTARLPFFAMEFIDGRAVDAYVRAEQPEARELLRLFAAICDAVQYAHDHGVVHRDLKPANILICNGSEAQGSGRKTGAPGHSAAAPKILDFGIARVTEALRDGASFETQPGQLIGTIAYMSPEQAAGGATPIDERSDVYALGIILYELLAGRLPYDVRQRGIYDALREIQEAEPRRLGDVDRRWRGDIETIVHKAIAKDRQQRYQHVHELAADVRRYLAAEPLSARPPTLAYQLRMFTRRNRLLVGGLVVIFLVLIAGFLAERTRRLQALAAEQRAQTAQVKAETEAQRSQRVVRFLNDMLQSVTPDESGNSAVTVRQVIDTVAAELHTELADAPEVEATVRYILGDTYHQLGAYREGVDMLRAAAAIHASLDLANEETAHIHHTLGLCLTALREVDEGLSEYAQALGLAQQLLGPESDAALQILNDRGRIFYQRGQFGEVAETLREILAIRERAFGADDEDLHSTRVNLAVVLQQQGRRAEAADLLRPELDWLQEHLGPTDSTTLQAMSRLRGIEFDLGHLAEADRLAEGLIERFQERYGPDHPEVASAQFEYGAHLQNSFRPAEAERQLREALRIREAAFGGDSIAVAAVLGRLGEAVARQGRTDEGIALQQRALAIYRTAPEPPQVDLAWALHGYALILMDAGRYADGLGASQEAVEILKDLYGADSPKTLIAEARIALIRLRAGDREAALALHEEILQRRRAVLGDEHPDVTMAMFNLACNEFELGQFADTRQTLEAVVPRFRKEYGEESTNHCRALVRLGIATLHDGDATTALQTATPALSCPSFPHLPDARLAMLAQAAIAAAHLEQGDLANAEAALEKCLQELELAPAGEDDWQSAYALLVQARILRVAGRNADAAMPAERAHAYFNARFGAEHPFTRDAADQLDR